MSAHCFRKLYYQSQSRRLALAVEAFLPRNHMPGDQFVNKRYFCTWRYLGFYLAAYSWAAICNLVSLSLLHFGETRMSLCAYFLLILRPSLVCLATKTCTHLARSKTRDHYNVMMLFKMEEVSVCLLDLIAAARCSS